MWRIYSQDKRSVRIRTKISDLLDSICIATIYRANCEHCVGKVDYVREADLVTKVRNTFSEIGMTTFGGAVSFTIDKTSRI